MLALRGFHGDHDSCYSGSSWCIGQLLPGKIPGSATRLQGGAQLPTQPRSSGSAEAATASVEEPLLIQAVSCKGSW